MPEHDPVDHGRRALIAATGALMKRGFVAGARPGANHGQDAHRCHRFRPYGGTIGGLWVKNGHEVLFSSAIPRSQGLGGGPRRACASR